MTWLDFQRVNLPNPRLFRFLRFLSYTSKFLCFSKALEASKVSPSEGITADCKFINPFFPKISLQMTSLDFQRLNLPNHRLFRFLRFLSYLSKFLCLSKALKASKVSPSEGIKADQKISKSVFAKNITSNDLFRLPEGQPT